MRSQIAILTYRRWPALKTMLDGINQHCPHYPCTVWDDCGQADNTLDQFSDRSGRQAHPELMATEFVYNPDKDYLADPYQNIAFFAGDRNLGVAGNSNRAIKHFMDSGADHLLLCNDDLHVNGNFVQAYAKAHEDLGVGLFCFNDFTHHDSYRWITYPFRGFKLKLSGRITGIMMSITRELIEKVGYFDASFGKFGEEHVDYTHRCRLAGGMRVNGNDMSCLDIEHGLLAHQDVATSVTGWEREQADKEAVSTMEACSDSYRHTSYYRPFYLKLPPYGGGFKGGGVPIRNLFDCGYTLVTGLV